MATPTGGKRAEDTPTSAPDSAEPSTTERSRGQIAPDAEVPAADDERSQYIPRERFDEVNDAKKAAESSLTAMQTQVGNLQTGMQQMAQYMLNNNNNTETPDPKEDADLQVVQNILGTDEAGQKAFEAIDKLATKRAGEMAGQSKADIMAEVTNIVQTAVGSLAQKSETDTTIDQLVTDQRVTPEQAATLKTQVATAISQEPQWGANQALLVNSLVGQLYAGGQAAPLQKPTALPNSPLQPGGAPPQNGSQAIKDAEALMKRRFPSLRNRTDLGDNLDKMPPAENEQALAAELQHGEYRRAPE